jgi:CHAD domain-containing protein
MKIALQTSLQHASEFNPSPTLGEYAHQIIAEQYRAIARLEKKVLADKDPEYLHRMRVASRRLRTALQVFEQAIKLPKAAQEKQVAATAKALGKLRDLDVQIADLQTNYRPNSKAKEQQQIDQVIQALRQQRRATFADTEELLTQSRYQDLKTAYETWLQHPQYTAIASQPLLLLLPDLLSPLLSTLLLHPGWLIPATDPAAAANEVLHDLRKACKHARYQAEFFAPFYGNTMQEWLEEVKQIQAKLGQVHDSQVLLQLMETHLPKHTKLPHLRQTVQQTQTEQMQEWDTVRQNYLNPAYRQHLHHLILQPNQPTATSEPDVAAAVRG